MYDANAITLFAEWLPLFGFIGLLLMGWLAWGMLR